MLRIRSRHHRGGREDDEQHQDGIIGERSPGSRIHSRTAEIGDIRGIEGHWNEQTRVIAVWEDGLPH